MLKLTWLGPPRVDLDGVPIHFETRKVNALLAYLSLTPTGNLREKLAALLWPEFDQSHAMANLRRALGSLTHSLPPGFIEADREMICWAPGDTARIDVLEFRAANQAVRDHEYTSEGICANCLAALESNAALYRGDFLDGLNLPDCPAFDDWQYLIREELKREFAWLLEQLASSLTRQAVWEKAAEAARRWISLDRLEATPQLALVNIYVQSGQRSLAQRQVEEYFRLFKEELGGAPDDETLRLFQNVLEKGRPQRAGTKPASGLPTVQVLLKTKLYLPKVRLSRVCRPHLLSKLNKVRDRKLVLVSAPAGFGKSTLLAEWAAQADVAVGWFSLDGGDNDPHQFLRYLSAAFDGLQEGAADNANVLLGAAPPVSPQTVMTVLLKDLERADEPLVLVLDDYQFITNQSIHDAINYFLERSSANLHLVIASRADPPLPLARLRAAEELLEVRTDDLRFTLEECDIFFQQVIKLDITPAEIQALAARTEGWVVGLQMAAVSLQNTPDRTQFIHTFSGSHRYILDYLIQEVLDRQPEHVRNFLLNTSILNRLCSELCDAVLGEPNEPAARILDYLDRANLFLIPLDHERRWYRYHHLFADLLATQLQRLQPSILSSLHLRASTWYEMNGQLDAAIEHALSAQDLERAADLVERESRRLGYQIEYSKMHHWIKRLPPEVVPLRPWMAITLSWSSLVIGNQKELAVLMDQIEENYEALWANEYSEADRRDLLANIKCLRAYMAFFAGDLGESAALSRQALELIRPEYEALHIRMLIQSGEVHQAAKDTHKACESLHHAVDLGIRLEDLFCTTLAMMRLYRSLRMLGKLTESEAAAQKVIRFLNNTQSMQNPVAGKVRLCWGDLMRERGQMEAAREWLDQGLEGCWQYGLPFDILTALVYKARWFYSQGLWDQALQLLDEGVPLLNSLYLPPPTAFAWWHMKVRVCLEKGDTQAVGSWLESLSQGPAGTASFLMEDAYMVQARLFQREGKQAQALEMLEKLVDDAAAGERNGSLIPILILQALSLDAQGLREAALDRLEESLCLAQPERFLMTFLDEGPQVGTLIRALIDRGLPPALRAYGDEISQAFENNIYLHHYRY